MTFDTRKTEPYRISGDAGWIGQGDMCNAYKMPLGSKARRM